jgi:hypothetical protein
MTQHSGFSLEAWSYQLSICKGLLSLTSAQVLSQSTHLTAARTYSIVWATKFASWAPFCHFEPLRGHSTNLCTLRALLDCWLGLTAKAHWSNHDSPKRAKRATSSGVKLNPWLSNLTLFSIGGSLKEHLRNQGILLLRAGVSYRVASWCSRAV